MESFLSTITQQAMNYAIRSGITITGGFAIDQCVRLLRTQDGEERDKLEDLQKRLESKIRIIAPAIDMIELITARGNSSLESAVTLTKNLRVDIQALGLRMAAAAANEELYNRGSTKAMSKVQSEKELSGVVRDMKKLLERIEDAVPLINLAITTSGVSLSTSLPSTISPSRLLQASTFLSAGDLKYRSNESEYTQVGPTFSLSMYMLFLGHAALNHDEASIRQSTWKEVIHKARLKLMRTSIGNVDRPQQHFSEPSVSYDGGPIFAGEGLNTNTLDTSEKANEYAYQMMLVEDLDDGRIHTSEIDDLQSQSFGDVSNAGIRFVIPIYEVSRLFYADTGKILNIGGDEETNNPVLLLKRDPNAVPPRKMLLDEDQEVQMRASSQQDFTDDEPEDVERQLDAQLLRDSSDNGANHELKVDQSSNHVWQIPSDLDPEWIAFEVFNDDEDSESDEDDTSEHEIAARRSSGDPRQSQEPDVIKSMSKLRLSSPLSGNPGGNNEENKYSQKPSTQVPTSLDAQNIQTSLSLLEMLIRLTSLQQFQQASHLTINDELLNFFLRESSTTGAPPGDADARQRIRMSARMRLGFDPYDESPIKPHGEEYQKRTQRMKQPVSDGRPDWHRDWSIGEAVSSDMVRTASPDSPLLIRNREVSSTPLRQSNRSSPYGNAKGKPSPQSSKNR